MNMTVIFVLAIVLHLVNAQTCPEGCEGPQGPRGRKGNAGTDGVPGQNGTDGNNGVDGTNGVIGRDGVNGVNGLNGRDGNDGQNGRDGNDGRDGADGQNGINGRDGRDCQTCGNSGEGSAGSSTYIRWGRTSCPTGATLVYNGTAGGGYAGQSGNGADKLCLPSNPEFGVTHDGFATYSARIRGAEYRTTPSFYIPFPGVSPPGDLDGEAVPCSMCHIPRGTVVMIPARMTCYNDWHLEYTGYIMSEYHSGQRSSWDCMDSAPENGGAAPAIGALFFMTEVECLGGLPCPPYVDGHELTCVVCSR